MVSQEDQQTHKLALKIYLKTSKEIEVLMLLCETQGLVTPVQTFVDARTQLPASVKIIPNMGTEHMKLGCSLQRLVSWPHDL